MSKRKHWTAKRIDDRLAELAAAGDHNSAVLLGLRRRGALSPDARRAAVKRWADGLMA